MNRTRKAWECPVFGTTSDLKNNMLPTYEDIIKCYEWNRLDIKMAKNTKKEPSFQEVADIVVEKIENIWKKASLPTVSHSRVQQMVKAYHLKYKNLLKSHPNIPKKRLKGFLASTKVLFDISPCKCLDFTKFNCPRKKRVPCDEQKFLTDQRSSREMIIGNTDVALTRKNEKKLKRKLRQETTRSIHTEMNTGVAPLPTIASIINSSSSSDKSSDSEDFQPRTIKNFKQEPAVSMNYAVLSQTCDRYGISDRAGAAIASVVLNETNMPIIDKNKLRRERNKARKNIIEEQKIFVIPALYSDGRKDKTLVNRKRDGKYYIEHIVEEHISLIKEPDSKYLGYITPTAGTAKCIEKEIINFFLTENVSLDHLTAIGCDGTNVNVGKLGGGGAGHT